MLSEIVWNAQTITMAGAFAIPLAAIIGGLWFKLEKAKSDNRLKGHTPIVKTSGRRQRVNAISAVNARGAFWHQTYGGKLNSGVFIHFLKDFLRGRGRPVLLVVDGLPAHKAKSVSA